MITVPGVVLCTASQTDNSENAHCRAKYPGSRGVRHVFEADSDLLFKIIYTFIDTLLANFNIEFLAFWLAFHNLLSSLSVDLGSTGHFSKSIYFKMSLALIEQ